jgi:predicted ATP-dependent serine protease
MAEKSTPAEIFKLALQKTLEEKYSNINPPPAYVTPFDVKTVDTLLGGGILSSMNLLQSTPETGKSTIALQYCANFLETYPNAIALYIDRESTEYDEKIQDRLATFGIDKNRFMYRSTVGDVKDIYKMVVEAVDIKQKVFKKSGVECYLTIVWDSIAATPSSKHGDAEDPKSLIG